MTAAKTTTRGTIDAEVTVADLQYIGCCTATRTVGTAVPTPAVFRDKTTATRAESIVFAVTLCEGRGIVDIGCADLRVCGCGQHQSRQYCM